MTRDNHYSCHDLNSINKNRPNWTKFTKIRIYL